jgi:hypothetical protein
MKTKISVIVGSVLALIVGSALALADTETEPVLDQMSHQLRGSCNCLWRDWERGQERGQTPQPPPQKSKAPINPAPETNGGNRTAGGSK